MPDDRSAAIAAIAAAHGWEYAAEAPPPALGGGLWEQVSLGVVRDRVRGPGWEAGRITGGERHAERVEQRGAWTVTTSVSVSTPERSLELGYLAIELPRRLPQLVLDARANDHGPFSSLRNRPRSDQRLSLEGDFDRHFRLYVPSGYERDALYVFTPDLMALLIDETGDLDVEIRDDRLIVTRPGGFDLTAPETWARFERIRATVGAKAWDRTERYADERVAGAVLVLGERQAADGVDPAGARLRGRVPRVVWLAVGIVVGVLAVIGVVAGVLLQAVAR